MFTDVPLQDVGAVFGHSVARGYWAASEITHINVFALKTVYWVCSLFAGISVMFMPVSILTTPLRSFV